jgi:hypothetical protein
MTKLMQSFKVEMSEEEEAELAIKDMIHTIDNRTVRVGLANQKQRNEIGIGKWDILELLELGNLQKSLNCSNIHFGNLKNMYEFVLSQFNAKFNAFNAKNSKLNINPDLRTIEIHLAIESYAIKFEIRFEGIDIICMNENRNNTLNAYFVLNRAPFIFRLKEDGFAGEISNDWVRTVIDTSQMNWTLSAEFDASNKNKVIKEIKHIRGVKSIFKHLARKNLSYSVGDFRSDLEYQDFESLYATECLLSQHSSAIFGKLNKEFASMLNNYKDSPNMICKCIQSIILKLYKKRYFGLIRLMQEAVDDNKKILVNNVNKKKNENIAFIRRAVVTPTRIIYYFKQENFGNRVTRKFGEDNFLRIRFRDEDLRKLNRGRDFYEMKDLYEKIRSLLIDGIVCCGRRYEFLAMSSSQMRDHGCWFFYNKGK